MTDKTLSSCHVRQSGHPTPKIREEAMLCSHNREQMTARGYFICFNLWYANSDAAADVLWSLVRKCFLNVTLVIFPAFFVRLVILCIKLVFSASLLFSGKTPRKTSVFSLLEVSVI